MFRAILSLSAVIVLTAPRVSLGALTGLDSIEVDPPGAGVHGQPVVLTLSGIWLDTCVPQFINHGNTLPPCSGSVQ